MNRKRNSDSRRVFTAGRWLTCWTAAVALVSLPIRATGGDILTSWKIDLGASSTYDDNILRYSDKYLSRFDHGEDPGRFHISSTDDLILMSAIRPSVNLNLIGSLTTTAAVDVRRRTYAHNPIKDWYYYGASLRQDVSKKLAAQINYSYIPQFYVRHYRDEDWVREYGYTPVTFQPYSFEKDEIGGWIQYSLFSATRVRGVISSMRYYYNEHFTEYDAKNSLYGFEIYQTIHKNLKLNGSFSIVYSRARGNDTTDASNDENTFILGGEYQLPKVFGHMNSIGLEWEYSRTFFTTHHPLEIDKEHAGRRDYEYRVSATYSFQVLDNLGLAIAYAWHKRDTRTDALENLDELAAEKDYRQYQIGLEVKYSLSFVPSEDSELKRSR